MKNACVKNTQIYIYKKVATFQSSNYSKDSIAWGEHYSRVRHL